MAMILTRLEGLCQPEFLRDENNSLIHVVQISGLEHWQYNLKKPRTGS